MRNNRASRFVRKMSGVIAVPMGGGPCGRRMDLKKGGGKWSPGMRSTRLLARAQGQQQQEADHNGRREAPLMAWPQSMAITAALLLPMGAAYATTYDLGPVPQAIVPAVPDTSPAEIPSGLQVPDVQMPDVQIPAVDLSSLQDNPLLIVVAVGALLVGIGLAVGLPSDSKPTAKAAAPATVLAILEEDPSTILVDIRSSASVKESGKPQLKGIKGKSKSLPYTQRGKDKEVDDVVLNYGEKFAKLRGITKDTSIVLLDSDGRKSPLAAKEILEFFEFKTLLYVAGGESAWKAAKLGWQEPSKGPQFSFPELSLLKIPDVDLNAVSKGVTTVVAESKEVAGVGVVVGAVAATSFLIINEIDLILEVVGLFGAINLLARNFLFAKQRSKTVSNLKTLVKEKIVPQEAGEDLKRLASSVLSPPEVDKVRPAEVEKVRPEKPAEETKEDTTSTSVKVE